MEESGPSRTGRDQGLGGVGDWGAEEGTRQYYLESQGSERSRRNRKVVFLKNPGSKFQCSI